MRVVLDYACYGIEVEGDRVVDAAPIARWMIGKTLDEVTRWITRKGGEWHFL